MSNIFNAIYLVWILSEILLNRFLRSGKSDKPKADKNSELYIWLVIMLSAGIGVFISYSVPCRISSQPIVVYAGFAFIVIGIIFRFAAIKQLGKFFTVDVTIRKDHQLMQSGFYKYVRHPSYTASLLSFLGFGISMNNWISLAIVFISVLAAFINRMNVEEKVLAGQFGEQYKEYIKKTKRLIPFLY